MVRTKLVVMYRDVDTLGHVNNAVYLSYIEHARVEMFREFYEKYGNFHFVIARVEIDYLHPLYLLDEVEVVAWVERIGTTSFTLGYEVFNSRGILCARARSVQVGYDPQTRNKIKIHPTFLPYLKKHIRDQNSV
ncbi:MAG: acyl-CoA thioesterase [Thermotogae bacterium]|nr:acyl-CoA thioesterase [Thermotogota bacterium]